MKPSNGSKTEIIPERSEEYLVSAAGFEPATHALKGSPTQLQTTTCTSSLLHARHNKINKTPTRHRSGCPEGARNPVLEQCHFGLRMKCTSYLSVDSIAARCCRIEWRVVRRAVSPATAFISYCQNIS